jgi:tetratricopeptide (TPR) repeat protein
VGDGGCKEDKFVRDVKLLYESLEDKPDDARSQFYLANTFYDLKCYEDALKWYTSRISLGGWDEERWYSCYRAGLCNLKLDKVPDFVYAMLMCSEICPSRLENMYELIFFFRCQGKHRAAYNLYKMIEQTLNSKSYDPTQLFFHNSIYIWKLYYEYIIVAYYVGVRDVSREYEQLKLSKIPPAFMKHVERNLKFYDEPKTT